MKAIILAGGNGLRLRPYTLDRPKALVEVAGKPIIDHQIEWLAKQGVKEAILACGYQWTKLKDHLGDGKEVKIRYSPEGEPLGTGGAIRQAMDMCDDDVVLAMNGDIITDLPLQFVLDWYNSRPTLAMMVVVPFKSPYGVITIDKLRTIRSFVEKPVLPDLWINGGIYLLSKEAGKRLPAKGDIEQTLFKELAQFGEMTAYPHYSYWQSIDSEKDIKEVEGWTKRSKGV